MSKVIQKAPKRSENGAKMEPKRAKKEPKCEKRGAKIDPGCAWAPLWRPRLVSSLFLTFFDAILGSILEVFGSLFSRKIDEQINAKIDAEKVLIFASKLIKISKKLSQNRLKT